jgi:hypothetical protein
MNVKLEEPSAFLSAWHSFHQENPNIPPVPVQTAPKQDDSKAVSMDSL